MDAEVDHAAAAGQRGVVEPRLVGPVGVVEDEVDRVDARRARPPRTQLAHAAASPRCGGRTGRRRAAGRRARAASTTARASAAVRPSGFWQNTAAPALERARSTARRAARSAWRSRRRRARSASSSSSESTTAAPGAGAARLAPRASGDGSATRDDLDRAARRRSPAMPVPPDPADAEEAEARRAALGTRVSVRSPAP